MKLIIEMPDEAYNELIKEQHLPSGLDVEYFIIHGTPLEEELEGIKTEIEDMGWDIYKTERKVPHKYVEKERIYELLDNHIKALKGE